MKKFEITKEQVLKVAEWGNSKDNELIKSWFPDAFKKKLEVGKWYKHNAGGLWYIESDIDEMLDCYAYGFFNDYEYFYKKKYNACNIGIKATEQEVKTALINEAKKKYPIGTNINCLVNKNNIVIVNDFSVFHYYFKDNDLYFAGVCIFLNGKWAEIIETITKEEAEKLLNKKII